MITRSVPWPPNVRLFGHRKPETYLLPELGVAIHGQSFPTAAVSENLVLAYPDAEKHQFNIGMLHTALAGRPGHAAYAPCSLDDLKSKHYDYWALGHVHEFEIVSENPPVVFPGNTQGRTIRETGPKGAVIVTVEDGQVVSIDRTELDVLRWARVEVDCTDASFEGAAALIRGALQSSWQENAAGLPLVVRVSLTGLFSDAGAMLDGASALRDDARAIATSISSELYIEKVKVLVTAPAEVHEVAISDDFSALIEQAGTDPALAGMLAEDLGPFLVAARTSLGPSEDEDLRRSADEGDWKAVLASATLALGSRLTKEV
ncbi:MAG: DNA repair exonuclease [Polaromonas sp.]|nr:DNA repair exonuclease [Gemmatimonadaceae bacterium]